MTPEAGTRLERLERAVQRSLGRRRALAALAIVALLIVFVLGLLIDDPREPGALVYAVPVAMLALALGTRAGALGALLGGSLFWLAGRFHDVSFSGAELGYRYAALLVLGVLIGSLANRLGDAELDAQRLLEFAHEGVWLLDDEGRTTFVNSSLANLLGTTASELLRSPVSRWLATGEPLADRLADRPRKTAEAFEARLVRSDGAERRSAVSVAPIVDRRGRLRGSLLLVTDVTERRRIEEELRRSEAGLAEAQRIAGVGSWEWDLRGDRITWSTELYRIYGLEPGSFDGGYDSYLARVHPDDRAGVDSAVRGALEAGTPLAHGHRVVRPDGSIRIVDDRGDFFVEEGEVVRMAGTVHDVTERVEVEEQLAVSAALRQRAVELNDTVVQGLAVARYRLGDDASDAAIAIDAALARAKDLVHDLLGDEPPVPGTLRREAPAGGGFTPFAQ